MNIEVRNRLVGGIVLFGCFAIFLPSLLTPKDKISSKPEVTIKQQTKSTQNKKIELVSTNQTIDEKDKNIQVKNTNSDKKTSLPNIPVVLESTVQIDKDSIKTDTQQIKNKGKWIQVASFSDIKSADKLVNQLNKEKYPTSTELVKVNGKTYKRVMIGPVVDSGLKGIINQLSKDGYNPKVRNN